MRKVLQKYVPEAMGVAMVGGRLGNSFLCGHPSLYGSVRCQKGRLITLGFGRLFGGRSEMSIAFAHRSCSLLLSNPGALHSLCAFTQGSPSTTASAARDWWGMVESSPGNVLPVWLCWSPHLSHGPHRL